MSGGGQNYDNNYRYQNQQGYYGNPNGGQAQRNQHQHQQEYQQQPHQRQYNNHPNNSYQGNHSREQGNYGNMQMGAHQQYWDGQQQQQHGHGQAFLPNHYNGSFSFNVNAATFVPQIQQEQMHQQQQYENAQMNAYHNNYQQGQSYSNNAPYNSQYQDMPYYDDEQTEHILAQFGPQTHQFMASEELYASLMNSPNATLLSEIQVGCEQLLTESDDVASWSAAIRQRFEDKQMDDESKRVALSLIIEMAFTLPPNEIQGLDPQYALACLLQTITNEDMALTRNVLIPVLKKYHDGRKLLENDVRVYLALLYAELYEKISIESGSRIAKLGTAVCDQVDDILNLPPTDSYMKSMIRVVKLTGPQLDLSEELRSRVDAILTKMGAFAKGSGKITESIKARITSLIDNRQRGWGRNGGSSGSSYAYNNAPAGAIIDEDGVALELSEEERTFLEKQIGALENAENEGDTDIDDQEIMKEFGKFVKEEVERNEGQKMAEMMSTLKVVEENEDEASKTEEAK